MLFTDAVASRVGRRGCRGESIVGDLDGNIVRRRRRRIILVLSSQVSDRLCRRSKEDIPSAAALGIDYGHA